MEQGRIPDWDPSGLLPPFVGEPNYQASHSPYTVGLADMVLRFGYTAHRRKILTGLLDYRAALHSAGLKDGFQWINGSFVEDVMRHSSREPKDIDVVTLFRMPTGITQAKFAQTNFPLLDPQSNKTQYGVDAYPVVLDAYNLEHLISKIIFWNNLWSHNRQYIWKGYLEIKLSDSEDAAARAVLHEASVQGWENEHP